MDRRPRTVAVVEDDPSTRTSIQRLLNAHGFEVELFGSAEAFLDRGPEKEVGCAVLDIHLAGMSGLELGSRLAAAGSDLPVIFITAIDDDTLRSGAIELGCVAYLHKPFPAASLVAAVKEALSEVQRG